jgi:hypothetical protein
MKSIGIFVVLLLLGNGALAVTATKVRVGKSNVQHLLNFLYTFTGDGHPVTGAFFQRFDHYGDTVSPYHTDGKAISLVVLLNNDFVGGEMTFLTRAGPTVIDYSVAGVATIHGEGCAHGNAALEGVKYQLTLLTFAQAKSKCIFDGLLVEEEDVVVMADREE